MKFFLSHNNTRRLTNLTDKDVSSLLSDRHLVLADGIVLTPANLRFLQPYSHLRVAPRVLGGALSEDDRALAVKRLNVLICRKCCARLSPRATHCRKSQCGYSSKLRVKKKLRETGKK